MDFDERPRDCWDRVYENRRGQGFSSLVYVLSGVVLIRLITCSEESYWLYIYIYIYIYNCGWCKNLRTRRSRPDLGS